MTWAVTFNIFGTKRKLIRSIPQLSAYYKFSGL